jgi:hypothetical protein
MGQISLRFALHRVFFRPYFRHFFRHVPAIFNNTSRFFTVAIVAELGAWLLLLNVEYTPMPVYIL